MLPNEEPITNNNNTIQPLVEATPLPRILYDDQERTIRYVELAATYDQDMSWHSAIKRLEAAFDGMRITLYQLHSEEAPIKLTFAQEALDALIVAYLTYLVDKDMPLHPHLTETPLCQAFCRYARARHEEDRIFADVRASLPDEEALSEEGNDPAQEELVRANLVAFLLTSAMNESVRREPAMRKALHPENWPELRAACLERAGMQCEYVDPKTGKRCPIRDQDVRRSKHSGRKWVVSLYACHINDNPWNPGPELICLCPSHHMKLDRNKALRERLSQRRRGYQITTMNSLLREINTTGITVTEHSDGYHWRIDGTDLAGQRTTAVAAIGTAIHQLRCALELTQRELQQMQHFSTNGQEYVK